MEFINDIVSGLVVNILTKVTCRLLLQCLKPSHSRGVVSISTWYQSLIMLTHIELVTAVGGPADIIYSYLST